MRLGKLEGRRRSELKKIRWLDSITDSMEMNLSKFRERVEGREDRRAVVHGVTKSWTRLRD